MIPSLTLALTLVGFYAMEHRELVIAVTFFIVATCVGFAGAVKHQAP